MESPRRKPRVKNFFSKNVFLAFEVIVQPPKHTFEIGIFSILVHYVHKTFFKFHESVKDTTQRKTGTPENLQIVRNCQNRKLCRGASASSKRYFGSISKRLMDD